MDLGTPHSVGQRVRRALSLGRYAAFGIVFGSVFPIAALLLDAYVVGPVRALPRVIMDNPIHIIIALAPFVLGTLFFIMGRRQLDLRDQLARALAAEAIANRDTLTGQGNRHRLKADMRALLEAARGPGTLVGHLLLIDLDKFKPINDTFGHEMGDRLLIAFSGRLAHQLGPGETLYRLGGDEFVVVSARRDDAPGATAARILEAFRRPFDLEQAGGDTTRLTISGSVGVSPILAGDTSESGALVRADLALYRAKDVLGAAHVVFDETMAEAARAEAHLEADLRADLESGLQAAPMGEGAAPACDAFTLAFQPLVSVASGRVRGLEALARWNHAERGQVPPDVFIPVAELTGLIVPLGRRVLTMACRAAAGWPGPTGVSVNVSAHQFNHPGFAGDVAEALRASGLSPGRLTLEVTESLLVKDIEAVRGTMMELRARGIRFALDDFGTGFSSLNHLRELPFDAIKLDRSFLARARASACERDLIACVTRLARCLKLSITVEGVETAEDMAHLKTLDVNEAQGYHLACPMPEGDVAAFLEGVHGASGAAPSPSSTSSRDEADRQIAA